MDYATQADIIALYGADALVVADRNGDGAIEHASVARSLASAKGEIDTYLAARYSLPLTEVPEYLKQLCVDVAIYRLALPADVLTEEIRRRYDDAIAALKRIAKGEAALVFTPVPTVPGETPAPTGPRPIVVGGPPRLFSRDRMREL